MNNTNKQITLVEYQEAALRTAKDMGSLQQNLIHAALGITSEGGEIATLIKASCVYGKETNISHLMEEAGDVLWFLSLLAKCMGITLEDIAKENIRKLKLRYPQGYSDMDAQMRWDKVKNGSPYSKIVTVLNEEDDECSLEAALLPLTYVMPTYEEDEKYDEVNHG